MGKASSNKKVARAAGTGGGRTGSSNTPWGYIGLIALIVVVGVALTWTSRSNYENKKNAPKTSTAAVAPKIGGTAWNEGLAVYACGKFQTPIKAATDKEGLTTDGNGVIHIAPKVKAAAGKNATLGEFASSVGVTLTSSSLKLPGGKTYSNGDKCDGKSAQLYVKQYNYVGAAAGTIETVAAPDVRLVDGALVTIAFVAPADKSSIPAPPAAVQQALKKINTATTTTVPSTTTTVPASSTTTAKSSSTTTPKSTTTTPTSSTTKSKSKS